MAQVVSLQGKKGIVAGIANAQSIAYGCARSFAAAGAELIVTYGHDKAWTHVEPLAPEMGNAELMLCDVSRDEDMTAVFERAREKWGRLDFMVHSIAFAPKEDLHGRVVECSRQGFMTAMDISCYSFIRMAHFAEPLMKHGGCLLTMSYYGAEKVVPRYNVMGPVKAALEAVVRYLAAELGPRGIRVHALSPGPLRTRAAAGIDQFERLLEHAAARAPKRHLVSIDDVGAVAAFLVSDAAGALTGHTAYVDAGYHIMG